MPSECDHLIYFPHHFSSLGLDELELHDSFVEIFWLKDHYQAPAELTIDRIIWIRFGTAGIDGKHGGKWPPEQLLLLIYNNNHKFWVTATTQIMLHTFRGYYLTIFWLFRLECSDIEMLYLILRGLRKHLNMMHCMATELKSIITSIPST